MAFTRSGFVSFFPSRDRGLGRNHFWLVVPERIASLPSADAPGAQPGQGAFKGASAERRVSVLQLLHGQRPAWVGWEVLAYLVLGCLDDGVGGRSEGHKAFS